MTRLGITPACRTKTPPGRTSSKSYPFLDKELQKILKKNEIGKRYVDKLVKVYLTSGEEKWLLLKLIDYRTAREELKTNTSPFALVVEAFLRHIDVIGDLKRVYEAKKHLIRTLFEKNFDKRRIEALLRFIDWTLQLPEGLERRLEEELPACRKSR